MPLTLDQLQAAAAALARQLAQAEADLHQLREALTTAAQATPSAPEIRQMHEAVLQAAQETGVSQIAIYGPCRRRQITRARWRAIEIATASGLRRSQIARAMGLDHASVTHALRRAADMPQPKRI